MGPEPLHAAAREAGLSAGYDARVTGESTPLEGAPPVADPICPYLGMVGDRSGHHTFPSRMHLCYAGEPAHVGLGFQADYCLGGEYPNCARFQRAEAAAAAGAPVGAVQLPLPHASPSASAEGAVTTAAPAPLPAASATLGQVRTRNERRGSPLVSALLGLALISTLLAFALAAGFIKPPGGPIGVVTPTPPASTGAPSASPSAAPSTAPPTASPTPSPSPSPSAATGEIVHVVQPGETLTSISELYDVPIAAIVARNGITDPNAIQAGQLLIIPLGATAPPPTSGPTGSASAGPSGSPLATFVIYIVEPGDNLSSIADMFDVSVDAILDANPDITDPNQIFVGQQIIIPAPAP